MFIENKTVNYTDNMPVHIDFCSIRHCIPHYHISDLEIVYCLKGNVEVTSGYEKISLSKGQLFTTNCREIHYIHSADDNMLMVIHLDLKNLSWDWDDLKYILFVLENHDGSTKCSPVLGKISDMMLACAVLFTESPCSTKLKSIADSMADMLCRYFSYMDYINDYEPVSDSVRQMHFKLSQYIGNNYSRKVSISDFSQSNYMDKSHISYLIKSTVHRSFSGSLNYVRCIHAEFLLLSTSKPNEEISQLCGFSDVKYFYAKFKEWYGKTPAVYRKEFERYMSEAEDVNVFAPDEMNGFMQEYFCEYHKNRTIAECTRANL